MRKSIVNKETLNRRQKSAFFLIRISQAMLAKTPRIAIKQISYYHILICNVHKLIEQVFYNNINSYKKALYLVNFFFLRKYHI
jgi:hypothetical protein